MKCNKTKEENRMKEFFAGMAFTLIMEGVAAVVVVAGKLREAVDE